MEFTIFVPGDPKPAGSKRAFPLRGKAKGRIAIVDACKGSKDWKTDVKYAVAAEYDRPLMDGPVSADFVFYQRRPKSHFGTGRNAEKLKDSAPRFPTGKPDALKLARAVEDALTGVVWTDDSRVVDGSQHKRYGDKPGVQISIEAIS